VGEFPVPAAVRRLIDETADGVAPTVVGAHGGAQSSTGTLAPDLVPAEALLAISAVVGAGAQKYSRNNWRRIPLNEQLRHALIHIYKYMMGDRSERHLWNALTRLAFAVAVEDEAYDFRAYEPLPERLTGEKKRPVKKATRRKR
jgi:hypothetical protein